MPNPIIALVHMKRKRVILVCLVIVALAAIVALGRTILYALSYTRDYYACEKCKSLGESWALRVHRYPIRLTPIRITYTLTGKRCPHDWRRDMANSWGILFNQDYWDRTDLCDFPWQRWLEDLENKRADDKKQ
jgi:hypothetical protein